MADSSNQKVVEGARLSGQGHPTGNLVEFDQDVFPHVVGEVKRVSKEELARVDAKAKANGLKGGVYHTYELTSEDKKSVERDRKAVESRSKVDQQAQDKTGEETKL